MGRIPPLMVSLLALTLGGCSLSYSDNEGYTHYLGFADFKVKGAGDGSVDAVQIRTLGLSLRMGETDLVVGLGYMDDAVFYAATDQ
ncbi:MAG: hypothetical protein H7Y60_00620 [Rhodospirillaceae bacterium]|nr:hypothetical protein [Rhodospirillales bacterium]